MAIASAWWTVPSIRAAEQVALGKMAGQSLNAKLVVMTMLLWLRGRDGRGKDPYAGRTRTRLLVDTSDRLPDRWSVSRASGRRSGLMKAVRRLRRRHAQRSEAHGWPWARSPRPASGQTGRLPDIIGAQLMKIVRSTLGRDLAGPQACFRAR